MTKSYGIHWFRRDLRVLGNPALLGNARKHSGRVVGLFVFDRKFLARPDFSPSRFQFFLATLRELQIELQSHGSDLLFLDDGPLTALPALFSRMEERKTHLPDTVSWNRDYEPFARERDARVSQYLAGRGVEIQTKRDHLVVEPDQLFKERDASKGYQVYGPFNRKWKSLWAEPEEKPHALKFCLRWKDLGETQPRHGEEAEGRRSNLLEEYSAENEKKVTVEIPKAGSHVALARLQEFGDRLSRYAKDRDYPALRGTSGLSIFLKNGSLTTGEVIRELKLYSPGKKASPAKEKFLDELIWREFYYHILWRNPEVETRAFQHRFENIAWENREDYFEAWKEGRTGFPIVDAGMRQLNQTGWMHNRVRMIVASFLTKDLLVDWRWGERYFMQTLLDGDLAPNNGGWQWAASTGCDPQPYFRIFNPVLQSHKFDPDGDYIRKYVPEIARLEGKLIHDPPRDLRKNYFRPIVEHSVQRKIALAAYLKATTNG